MGQTKDRRIGSLFFLDRNGQAPVWVWAVHFVVGLLVLSGLFVLVLQRVKYAWNWPDVIGYWRLFLQGWGVTVGISLAALACSLTIGIVGALAAQSRIVALRAASTLYVELIRGTPLLVQIYIFFYIIFDVIHFENRFVAGVLILSIFSGAYVLEIIRSALVSIGKSQWESAMAVGFSPTQAYRYVIFPQAFRIMLPPLAGQLVSLIKDSSLLSLIAISELTLNARNVASYTYSNFESYLPLAIGYLILTLPISIWARHLESQHHFET